MTMLFKDDLVKNTAWIFLGSMIANVFNYLFQITMGRMLPVQTFGEMNALFSTMIILSVPFTSIPPYLAKGISNYYALEQYNHVNHLIITRYKTILIAGAVFFLSGSIFSGSMKEYLKIQSVIPILLLFVLLFISTIIPIHTGILQGFQRIKTLSFLPAGTGITKYAFCVALVAMGMGLNGVMIGIILSTLLIGFISFRPIAEHLKIGRSVPPGSSFELFSLVVPIFLANLSMAVLTQADIILVKYFFPPYEAGIYSSAAIIGKIVLYLPAAIVISLFPMVASNQARSKSTLSLILKSLIMTLILSGGGAVILYLFSGLVVSLFFGNRFSPAIPLIGLFGLAMLPMALIMVVMNYNLARGSRGFSWAMIFTAALQLGGMLFFHNQLMDIVKVILFSGIFGVTALFSLLFLEYYQWRKLFSFGQKRTNPVNPINPVE